MVDSDQIITAVVDQAGKLKMVLILLVKLGKQAKVAVKVDSGMILKVEIFTMVNNQNIHPIINIPNYKDPTSNILQMVMMYIILIVKEIKLKLKRIVQNMHNTNKYRRTNRILQIS